MKNWSSIVDTSPGSVDTVLQILGKKVVSTLVQAVSTLETLPNTFWAIFGQCVDTSPSSVDTSALPEQNL
ncbi:hypothetical protein Taro_014388 [Colocasia esculenta]|uniref:Uncharacterized protein n=1 Tax=Colocasia esculenta TaxID=4460 RepID=A0A843U8X6_COLES|nr:hypothetical protein [Colocasia esculenta]